jgi:uncharacterized SAM-binding protein YcdF (DUF218 family)
MRGLLGLVAACAFAYALMVLLCTEAGASFLSYTLERQAPPVRPQDLRQVQAIVVLGGRTDRIHHAAALQRQTGLPLLLSGKGTGDSGFAAESQKMEEILRRQYGQKPRWVEVESFDTRENALYSHCLLGPAGVRRIALLTDPSHMPRARALFEAAGFDVVPAPAPDAPRPPQSTLTIDSFIPSSDGVQAARGPAKEWAGTLLAPLEARLRGVDCASH